MMEYGDVMKEFKRMCLYYTNKSKCPMGCPMSGCNISQCRKIAFQCPAEFASTVMAWAAEHPEPVYPTWYEFLGDVYPASWDLIANKRVPADIAQKLGIEPKEG